MPAADVITALPAGAASPPSAAFGLEDQRRMAAARRYFAWQARLVLPHLGRRVVEVGCGIGNFTAHLIDRDCVIALDRDPARVAALACRFSDRANLHLLTCDIGDDGIFAVRRWQPDSCVCLNVLEHVADDQAALSRMAAILEPAGTIVLIVPAFPALFGPIDRNLGHHRRYTRAGLQALATAAGLRVRRLGYWNAVGFFAWWANARVFRRAAQSPFQIAVFDGAVVPVAARIESVLSPPLGQSLWAVLEKRQGPP